MIIEFKTGETTCAWEKGKFCRFFGAKRFGQTPWCTLFDSELQENEQGWTTRCKQCLTEESQNGFNKDGKSTAHVHELSA